MLRVETKQQNKKRIGKKRGETAEEWEERDIKVGRE